MIVDEKSSNYFIGFISVVLELNLVSLLELKAYKNERGERKGKIFDLALIKSSP